MLGMPTDDELEFGRHYVRLLRAALTRIESLSSTLINSQNLTVPQFLTLVLIDADKDQTQVDIVCKLESDPNTVSAILRRLEARNLIVRSQHPTDRRANILALTDEGMALTHEALVETNKLSMMVGRSVPKRQAAAIASWLESLAQIEEVA